MIKMWEDVLLMLLLEVMIDVYTFMRIEINEDNDPLCFLSEQFFLVNGGV